MQAIRWGNTKWHYTDDKLTTYCGHTVGDVYTLGGFSNTADCVHCLNKVKSDYDDALLLDYARLYNKDLTTQVGSYVAERGYREGWTANQFIVRQVLKVADELGEAVGHFQMRPSAYLNWVMGGIAHVAAPAADFFRSKVRAEFDCEIKDKEILKSELCDIIIPALSALAELGGTDQDILNKASSDVKRGTNYKEQQA